MIRMREQRELHTTRHAGITRPNIMVLNLYLRLKVNLYSLLLCYVTALTVVYYIARLEPGYI